MKKVILFLTVTVLSSALLFAGPGGEKKASGALKIGAIHYNQTAEDSISIAESIRAACKANSFTLVEADINGDKTKYQQLIDNLILQKVDAIIDAVWDDQAGARTAEKCKAAGVILVACDVYFSDNTHMVGAENYAAGTTAGTYMADYIKKVWDGKIEKLLLVNEVTAGQATVDRLQGSVDALVKGGVAVPANIITWVDSQGQTLLAKQQVTDYLTAHPADRKILIGALNDASGLGAYSAAQSMGREKDVLIYSYNGESSAAEYFKQGNKTWVASVWFGFDQYGPIAVDTIKDIKAGRQRPLTQSPVLSVMDTSSASKYHP
jgi:ABC-type sugar transport system substrate-binding protein